MKEIPEILIKAQEMQKIGDYRLSMKMYKKFFENNPDHPLRFKALFEVADNCFHAGDYVNAKGKYERFLEYCAEQQISFEERGWVEEYSKLAKSRIKMIQRK